MKFGSKSKVLALVLSALMMVSVIPMVASAASPITVTTPVITDSGDLYVVDIGYSVGTSLNQVTLLAVKGSASGPLASTEENIVYVDQKAGGTTGTFSFKVKKADFTGEINYVYIKVGGTSVTEPGATDKELSVGWKILVGDYDDNGNVTAYDALLLLKKSANIDSVELVQENAVFNVTLAVDQSTGTAHDKYASAFNALAVLKRSANIKEVWAWEEANPDKVIPYPGIPYSWLED